MKSKQDKKNNMRASMQKPIIDAEAFMKFFEETTGAKFVDAEIDQPALDILAKQKDKKKKIEKKAKEGEK